jgi:hypothetical protein
MENAVMNFAIIACFALLKNLGQKFHSSVGESDKSWPEIERVWCPLKRSQKYLSYFIFKRTQSLELQRQFVSDMILSG